MNNLIEVMYGKELFDNKSCQVSVLAVPCKTFNTFKEAHIESAARKDDCPITRNQFHGQTSAWAEDARSDLGKWTKASYDCPDGIILKIWVHKFSGYGQRIINASQLIRPRKDAAFRELKIQLSGHSKARYQYAIIKGRFDVLTLEQAKERGVKLNSRFEYTFKSSEVAKVMEVKILEKERGPSVKVRERTVRNKSGETVVIQKRRVVRALDLKSDE